MKRVILWVAVATAWLLFFAWYTDLAGPLSDAEVQNGIQQLESQGFRGERLVKLEKFLSEDTGGQFLMVNVIDLNDAPPSMPGFGADATASDYINHYMEHMYGQLLRRACHPVFFGLSVGSVLDLHGVEGPAASGWDQAALLRYRSRRSFLEIITHPDMHARHDYKLAGMTKTLAYPVEPGLYLSDLRVLLLLILLLVATAIDWLLWRRDGGVNQP